MHTRTHTHSFSLSCSHTQRPQSSQAKNRAPETPEKEVQTSSTGPRTRAVKTTNNALNLVLHAMAAAAGLERGVGGREVMGGRVPIPQGPRVTKCLLGGTCGQTGRGAGASLMRRRRQSVRGLTLSRYTERTHSMENTFYLLPGVVGEERGAWLAHISDLIRVYT